jgi:MFS family permease
MASTFPQFSMTLESLAEASGLSRGLLLTGDTVKACAIIFAMLVSGFVYNRAGMRKTFVFSILASVLPQFLLPAVRSPAVFFILKILQGLGPVIFPVFLVIIMNRIGAKNRGLAMAVFNGIFYCGGGIGGALAGFVIVKSGWRASYYVPAWIMIALGCLWLFFVREAPPGERPLPSPGPGEPEAGAGNPRKLPAADPKIWLLGLGFLATTWSVQAISVDMPVFGAFLGFDEGEIGRVLSGVTVAMLASCLFSGRIADSVALRARRRDRARILVLLSGYVLTLFSLILLIVLDNSRFFVFFITAFLFTAGASWGLGVFYSILPEIYDRKRVPLVTGITGGIGDIGMPAAPFVVGVLFGLRGAWDRGWAFCAAVTGISILALGALLCMLPGSGRDESRQDG